MCESGLRAFHRRLGAEERADIGLEDDTSRAVLRNGSPIELSLLDSLIADFERRLQSGDWETDRPASDRWLAPRMHFALRLTRREASNNGVWDWLAVRHSDYVSWRWGKDGAVAENRWHGPIHKQAIARLWWGGELFRNGPDYSPVQQAFGNQDVPNSYLHRPLARCRSLAVAIVEQLAPLAEGAASMSSDNVNSLARVLNLATAGAPPEIETGFQADDEASFIDWIESPLPSAIAWVPLPHGPDARDTTFDSLEGGRSIVHRGMLYAGLTRTEET